MEETKGYKPEDMQVVSIPSASSNLSSSGIEKGPLSSVFNAIDRESVREEKRLNKIMSEAKK
jgi:hypothetical protein